MILQALIALLACWINKYQEHVIAYIQEENRGSYLRRDNLVSVLYAEELNSTKSSVFLQRTDRHGILGQKSSDFQRFL